MVRTNNAPPMHPHSTPSRFRSAASVIFTAFADLTRKITDILRTILKQIKHIMIRTPFECNKFQLTIYVITHSYLHVFSMSAPYVRENPISRSQIRAVQVYRVGGGYITIDCWRRLQKLCIETQ